MKNVDARTYDGLVTKWNSQCVFNRMERLSLYSSSFRHSRNPNGDYGTPKTPTLNEELEQL